MNLAGAVGVTLLLANFLWWMFWILWSQDLQHLRTFMVLCASLTPVLAAGVLEIWWDREPRPPDQDDPPSPRGDSLSTPSSSGTMEP